jgi:predicted Rossmann-fold nucleotide-binding protein
MSPGADHRKVLPLNESNRIDALVSPEGSLDTLSQREIMALCGVRSSRVYETFRLCCLAVLNSGTEHDDTREVLATYPDFDVQLVQTQRGVKFEISNAPPAAFVDGRMIRGIREQLSSVLRDILFVHSELESGRRYDLTTSAGITDAVFGILRNAAVVRRFDRPLVVCWGGHSIGREEYEYTKRVGYELGLRGVNICTGCGPGAMKGPMKGAAIGHAKQRIRNGRYIGISEPGIVAAESPNPIVNELVIMPDMEKRLEAFVRVGHGIIVFPGGVGTAEEILYLLGLLLHPENLERPFPLIFTGPESSAAYFDALLAFVELALGAQARAKVELIVGNPRMVAMRMKDHVDAVLSLRGESDESFAFNWLLHTPLDQQHPFETTHENMAALALHRDQPVHRLAANLRRAFSGIVAGNVKEAGMRCVEERGPFELRGDPAVMQALDRLLRSFVAQGRMRLPGRTYVPSYRVIV